MTLLESLALSPLAMPTRSRHIPNEILDAIINTEGSRVPFYWNGPSTNSAIPVLCEGITGIAPDPNFIRVIQHIDVKKE